MLSPDLAGLVDAQRRLRGEFGVEVTFWGEPVENYPPGTPLDPETGRPYDPTIKPTTASAASAAVTCTVAFRSNTEDQQEVGAIGIAERTHVQLQADIDDAPAIEGAIAFDVHSERFKVEAMKPDGIGPAVQRFLVWGRKE